MKDICIQDSLGFKPQAIGIVASCAKLDFAVVYFSLGRIFVRRSYARCMSISDDIMTYELYDDATTPLKTNMGIAAICGVKTAVGYLESFTEAREPQYWPYFILNITNQRPSPKS